MPRRKKTNRPLRTKKKTLYRMRRWATVGSLAAACAAAAFLTLAAARALLNADGLKIDKIICSPCRVVDVRAALQQAGISRGENILTIDLGKASRNLEQDPWIHRAVVKRILPGTVEVRIAERKPIAVIDLDEGYLVDCHGDIFPKAGRPAPGLPRLTGLGRREILEGSAADRALHASLSLIQALENSNLPKNGQVTISIDGTFGLTLVTAPGGTSVFMGFEDFESKLQLLRKIKTDLVKRGVAAEAIDLHSTDRAYVRIQSA